MSDQNIDAIVKDLEPLPGMWDRHLPVEAKARKLQQRAEKLLAYALELRMNITIERINVPPLAMGNTNVVVTTWPMREMAQPIERPEGRT